MTPISFFSQRSLKPIPHQYLFWYVPFHSNVLEQEAELELRCVKKPLKETQPIDDINGITWNMKLVTPGPSIALGCSKQIFVSKSLTAMLKILVAFTNNE